MFAIEPLSSRPAEQNAATERTKRNLREEFLASVTGLVEVINSSRNIAAVERQALGVLDSGALGGNIDLVS